MPVYLHDIPLTQALKQFELIVNDSLASITERSEEIKIDEYASGRVLSEAVWAKISSPHYHASAMDGFALRAEETLGASLTNPIELRYDTQTLYVDTGDPLPKEFNAVLPIENTEALTKNGTISSEKRSPFAIRIRESVRPWQHVRVVGEDMVATQLVLPAFHCLKSYDLGALLGSGNETVRVFKKPIVSVIPTGSELVEVGTELKDGDILEYNSILIAGKVNELGGECKRHSIVKDDITLIQNKVAEVAEVSDLILLNAGSSAGAEDFSSTVIESLGEVHVHGIAVRPGHPVILGFVKRKSGKQVPIIGVPGYPVSAAMTVDTFVKPFISLWYGYELEADPTIEAKLIRNLISPAGDDDFVRVVMGKVDEDYITNPLSRGAGVISSLVKADGILKVEHGLQGFKAGDKVNVSLLRSQKEIDSTILSVGSHDITLDVLAEFLAHKKRRLSAAHVGSLAGLIAINRKETHISQAHLFDKETNSYNIPFIKKYVKVEKVKLVQFVSREQGFIVPKGNPKAIQSVEDLKRNDLFYVNRQRGAGTRVLFDYYLEKFRINENQIKGYENEEFSHLSVAVAVKSGRADLGMGIAAAAYAMDLDFIPICEEEYQLIIPNELYTSDLLAPLFEVLEMPAFVNKLASMKGYRVQGIGEVVYESK